MSNTARPRFHLAFPVHDLTAARSFYGDLLGCSEGREDPERWIDFDFFGHQIVAHLAPEECGGAVAIAAPDESVDRGPATAIPKSGRCPQGLAPDESLEGSLATARHKSRRFPQEPGDMAPL